MLIKGLQKTTLLDFPEKVACTVFTGGCNFRCPFCHNASLVKIVDDERIDIDEFFSFLKKRVNILDGVCITGGEPLLQKDIFEFIQRIKSLGYAVKLDTNGAYPNELKALINAGLIDYVAMDVKNSRSKYSQTCGTNVNIDDIQKSMDILASSGIEYEFRTTVVRELHSSEDIIEIAEWISDAPKYFLQSFKDSGDILSGGLSSYSDNEMKEISERARKHNPRIELRGIS
jgi:pyruvate formate lyase activating enzyme